VRCYDKTKILLDPAHHNQNILDSLWGVPNDAAANLFSSCHPTCKVRIIPGCPYWELETFDCQNRRKTVGGDEFYLTYTDRGLMTLTNNTQTSVMIFAPAMEIINVSLGSGHDRPIWTKPASAVAWLTDMNNGRYRIDFQASPMSPVVHSGSGVFTVYFQYTCGIGRMAYPTKRTWRRGGQTLAWAQSLDLPLTPPIRPFEPPPDRPNLKNYSTIIPVGDSLMRNFLAPLGIQLDNIRKPLNSTTLELWKSSIYDRFYFNRHGIYPRPDLYPTWDKFENRHMEKVENLTNAAIIAGSCAWDIMERQDVPTTFINRSNDHEWEDHRAALTNLFAHVHEQYPEATMLWKSCSGLHLHIAYQFRNDSIPRLKYMSTYRAWSMHQAQQEVVQQAKHNYPGKVYFLDVYPAFFLCADRSLPGDGRHYDSRLNALALNWFANNI
jgi:hypothetical protein